MKVKAFIKIVSAVLILCLFSILMTSCGVDSGQNGDDTNGYIPTAPVAMGFEIYPNCPDKIGTDLYCAYKFDNCYYDTNEKIPFALYYGANVEKRVESNESSSPIVISITNDRGDYVILKELTVDELFVDKYDLSISYQEEYDVINYSYCENFEIPSHLLTDEKGSLQIKISHLDENKIQNPEGFGYGFDYHTVHYKIEGNTVALSTSYLLIADL